MTRNKINQSGNSGSGSKTPIRLGYYGNFGGGKIFAEAKRAYLSSRNSGNSGNSSSSSSSSGSNRCRPKDLSSSVMETNELCRSRSASSSSSFPSSSSSSSFPSSSSSSGVKKPVRKRKLVKKKPASSSSSSSSSSVAAKKRVRRKPIKRPAKKRPIRKRPIRKPKLHVETIYNKRAKKRPRLLPYQARLSVQSMNKKYPIIGNRIPNLPCRVLQGQCLYRNPITKRIGKQIVDGSEDKPYIIELKLNTTHPNSPKRKINKRKTKKINKKK